MNNKTAWIIDPRDSLIVRDGKPFGANITHATSLDFPFPSTTTGGVRTRAGLDNTGKFDTDKISDLVRISVKGPLLAGLNPNTNQVVKYYLSAPADALLIQNQEQQLDGKFSIKRLLPLELGNAITNLSDGLRPVGVVESDLKAKPYTKLRFWDWKNLERWLIDGNNDENCLPNHYGISALLKDSRTHVAIIENFASNDGDLFSTRGLEFNHGDNNLTHARKLALIVFLEDEDERLTKAIQSGIAPLGGERRLVSWRKSEPTKTESADHLPTHCPKELMQSIKKDGFCRLMLLTPAYFSQGMPQNTDEFKIKAIACDRYQTVSGWDFASNRPKPTRRLLPAGSILFLELHARDREKWIEQTWFSCIGDDPQAINDGFGLSILGTWNPKDVENGEGK